MTMLRTEFNKYLKLEDTTFIETALSDRSKSILLHLLADCDANKSDVIGPDPFSLRDISFPKEVDLELVPLKSIVEKYNLADCDLTKLDFDEKCDIQNQIPKIGHAIWLGSPLDYDKRTIDTIETWRRHEPAMPIIVWTDMVSPNMSDEDRQKHQASLKWCAENNIILLNTKIIMPYVELLAYYLYERQRPNFGGTSDILRIYILKHFGGIYFDIDIVLKD